MKKSITLKEFLDVDSFLLSCEHFLSKSETFYNLKLGIANSIRDKKIETSAPLYFGIFENEKLIGCALRSNHDRPLAISFMSKNAVNELVDFLISKNQSLHGVIGEIEAATHFKDLWASKNNLQYKLSIHLGVYEADEIIPPKAEGSIILGTEKEMKTIFQFVKGFCQDCFPDKVHTDENIQKLADRHIKNQSLYLLKNSQDELISIRQQPIHMDLKIRAWFLWFILQMNFEERDMPAKLWPLLARKSFRIKNLQASLPI